MNYVHDTIVSRAKLGFRDLDLRTVYTMGEWNLHVRLAVTKLLIAEGYTVLGEPTDFSWKVYWK